VADLRVQAVSVLSGNRVHLRTKAFYRDDTYTPFSLFSRFYRFGATSAEIRRVFDEVLTVAIASTYTTYPREALEVARIAKEVSREVVTVMGVHTRRFFPNISAA
jgi:hypothetical protein